MPQDIRRPLSVQQEFHLGRESEQHRHLTNLQTVVALPEPAPVDAVRDSVAALTEAEDMLRVTSIDADGWTVDDDGGPPGLEVVTADSADAAVTAVAARGQERFDRRGGPLWSVTALGPDGCSEGVSWVCGTFDRLVVDDHSLRLAAQAFLHGRPARRGRTGNYGEWVEWQRSAFCDPNSSDYRSHAEQWRRLLGDTAPDRVVPGPFLSPTAEPTGSTRIAYHTPPFAISDLVATGRHERVSPFQIYLAACSAALATQSGQDDITVRVVAHGRSARYTRTVGWFSDSLPVRLGAPGLGDPGTALKRTRSVWPEVLKVHLTPWQFVVREAGAGTPRTGRSPQVVLNFLPRPRPGAFPAAIENRTVPGGVSGLQLTLSQGQDRGTVFRTAYDPGIFDDDGVRALVDDVLDNLARLAVPS